MASTVKSNRSYAAIQKVRDWKKLAEQEGHSYEPPIPLTKRGAHEYQYPHDHPNAFVHFDYLPESIRKIKSKKKSLAYEPKNVGVESRLLARLQELWKQ